MNPMLEIFEIRSDRNKSFAMSLVEKLDKDRAVTILGALVERIFGLIALAHDDNRAYHWLLMHFVKEELIEMGNSNEPYVQNCLKKLNVHQGWFDHILDNDLGSYEDILKGVVSIFDGIFLQLQKEDYVLSIETKCSTICKMYKYHVHDIEISSSPTRDFDIKLADYAKVAALSHPKCREVFEEYLSFDFLKTIFADLMN